MERSIDNKSRKEGTRKRYGRREREEGRNIRVGEGKGRKGPPVCHIKMCYNFPQCYGL